MGILDLDGTDATDGFGKRVSKLLIASLGSNLLWDVQVHHSTAACLLVFQGCLFGVTGYLVAME